jgi:hypothetical protein
MPTTSSGSKPRLALLSDVQGWAFCQQMHDLEVYLSDRFDIEHLYVLDWVVNNRPVPNLLDFDVVYCPYHRWHLERYLPWHRTLGSLRAQWLLPEVKRTPQAEEFAVVNRFRAFNVVNRANYDEYRPGCPNLYYLTNPVNTRRFSVATPRRPEVIASWNGNAGHSNALEEDVKGFYSIVHPACKRAEVPLVFAEYNTCRKAPEESQLAKYGETGIRIVERTVEAFVRELSVLKQDPDLVYEMGQINRRSIAEDWSWDAWAEPFARFLSIPLEGAK